MKHFYFLFIFLIPQQLLADSSVWLVESGKSRLFMAGTIHVLRASDFPLPGAFDSAYKQSQVLSFETDIGASSGPEFQAQLMQAVTLAPGKTLKDFISAQTYAQLETYFKANGMNFQALSSFKPAMIAMTLTLLELRKLGFGGHGVDQHYYNQAKQDNKTTLALETVQQQIDFIANMGKGQEDLMLQQTLDDIESLPRLFGGIVSSWRDGDVQQLEELVIQPMMEFESIYQELLVKRNANWLPQIVDYLKTAQTEMVLVGSAHLIGEDGLVRQLKKAGYRVTQLK